MAVADKSWTTIIDEELRVGMRDWPLSCAPRTAFWFLRHGQTSANQRGVCQGHADVPLDEVGRQQARKAGALLKAAKLRRIVSSDLVRAHETARLAATESQGPTPIMDARLRERSFGSHEGIATPAAAWLDKASDGEPIEFFARRILSAVETVIDGPEVLICSHGGCLRALAAGLDVRLESWCYDNALPLRFERSGNGWSWTAIT